MSKDETYKDRLANLIRSRQIKGGERLQEDIEQYLANADDVLRDARLAKTNMGRFILAYEGIHFAALAVLNHLEARPGDGEGHRTAALQFSMGVLELDKAHAGALPLIISIHQQRNQKIYRSPLPPLSAASAKAALDILSGVLPRARRFVVPKPLDDANDGQSVEDDDGPNQGPK